MFINLFYICKKVYCRNLTYYQNVTYKIIQSHLFFSFRMLKKTSSCATNLLDRILQICGSGPTVRQKPLTGPGPGLTKLNGTTPTGSVEGLVVIQVRKPIQNINLQYCFSLFSISNLLYIYVRLYTYYTCKETYSEYQFTILF